MKSHYSSVGLEKLCRLFGKSRQAFYDRYWTKSNNQIQDALIINLVKSVRKNLPKVGGVKLLYILKEDFTAHKIFIGRDRFFRLLRKYELLVKIKKRFVRTTNSNHHFKNGQILPRTFKLLLPNNFGSAILLISKLKTVLFICR